jgi:hypothetical protein
MGLKNWLAKNTAGVGGYGTAIRAEVVKNGLALGRILYLGHGTRATPCEVVVFEDSEHLSAEGFTLYCPDPLNRPSLEDSSLLSTHCRSVGIAFAAHCTFTAAYNLMKQANASVFTRSMGASTRVAMRNSGVSPELLNHYNKLARPTEITKVLNMEKPGTGDILSMFLIEASKHSPHGTVGFQRTGILGFDVITIPLAEETVKMVNAATHKFSW